MKSKFGENITNYARFENDLRTESGDSLKIIRILEPV